MEISVLAIFSGILAGRATKEIKGYCSDLLDDITKCLYISLIFQITQGCLLQFISLVA